MDWEGIRTAILDVERRKLGLPSRQEMEDARLKREQQAALSASNLETAGVNRDLLRAKFAALPEEQRLAREREQAMTSYYTARTGAAVNPPERPLTGDAYLMSLPPDQAAELARRKRAMEPPRANGGGGLSPASEAAVINRLSTQWTKANATGRELHRQYSLMQDGLKAARAGDMAAGSQAVLVTFQKILDPTSVVRESEYARSATGLSALSRIQGAFDRLRQGGAGVPVQDLEAFANLANDFLQNSANETAGTRARLEATAKRYGIPNEVVFDAETAPAAAPLTKTQTNQRTGEKRTLISTDGGATWQPAPRQ